MKAFKLTRIVQPAAALLLGLSCAASWAAEPERQYACQVKVRAGFTTGLVMVQTDSLERAEKTAIGSDAIIDNQGTRSRATAVVECVPYFKERFKDIQFQAFFESLPM